MTVITDRLGLEMITTALCMTVITDRLGLEIITTAKFSTHFHTGSPRNFEASFHGSPPNFKLVFMEENGSRHHTKEQTGKPSNPEIQIF